jgi:hypothetical protein
MAIHRRLIGIVCGKEIPGSLIQFFIQAFVPMSVCLTKKTAFAFGIPFNLNGFYPFVENSVFF